MRNLSLESLRYAAFLILFKPRIPTSDLCVPFSSLLQSLSLQTDVRCVWGFLAFKRSVYPGKSLSNIES